MRDPKVTIMIPTYNQAAWVGQSVESALAQTYPNLEVVVCDDASSDQTAEVVRQFTRDPRFRYVRNADNLGRVANYRESLSQRATGDWVLNLDGDDFLIDPDFVRDGIDAASRVGDRAVMVLAGYEFLSPLYGRLTDAPTRERVEVVPGPRFLLRWVSSSIVHHVAALYRRDVALRIGFYERDILSSDCESLRRLALHGEVVLMGRTVGHWRTHDANSSHRLNVADHVASLDCVFSPYLHAEQLGFGGEELDRWRDEALADQVAVRMGLFLAHGRAKEARELLERLRDFPAARRLVMRNPKLRLQLFLSSVGGKPLMDGAAVVNSLLKRRSRRRTEPRS